MSQRASYFGLGIFLVAMLVLLLAGQSSTAPTEPREQRIFAMVKNMRASGDYLVPRIKNEPHVNKPPFYVWLATGCNVGEILPTSVANRLPSILAALATMAGLFFFCHAAGVPHLALPSAILLAACRTYISEARIANFDILLAAFCFAANAFFWFYIHERRTSQFLLAGAAFTLAFFTKATPVFAMALVPWLILCWMEKKRVKQEFPEQPYKTPVLPIASIVIIGTAVGLAWFAAIWCMVPDGKKIIVEAATLPFGGTKNPNFIVRFLLQYIPTDALDGAPKEKFALHYKSFYYFVEHFFMIIIPAALFLPLLIGRIWRTRGYQNMPLLRWMGVSFLAVLVIFSLIKQKQEAYMLPILPFVCILLADALMAFLDGVREKIVPVCQWEWGWMNFLGYASAVLCFCAIVPFAFYFHAVVPHLLLLIVYPLLFTIFGIWIFLLTKRGDFTRMLLASVAWCWLSLIAYNGSIHVWMSLIDTNQYQQETTLSPKYWEKVFKKYPFLKKSFRYPPEGVKEVPSEAGEE